MSAGMSHLIESYGAASRLLSEAKPDEAAELMCSALNRLQADGLFWTELTERLAEIDTETPADLDLDDLIEAEYEYLVKFGMKDDVAWDLAQQMRSTGKLVAEHKDQAHVEALRGRIRRAATDACTAHRQLAAARAEWAAPTADSAPRTVVGRYFRWVRQYKGPLRDVFAVFCVVGGVIVIGVDVMAPGPHSGLSILHGFGMTGGGVLGGG